jgi:predicted RNA-binding protein with RPS1 domain
MGTMTITVHDLMEIVLYVCAALITISSAVGVIAKTIEKAKAPNEAQNEKIKEHEEWLMRHDRQFEEVMKMLEKDNQRIKSQEQSGRITNQSLLALLSHALNGNDVESLEKAKNDLEMFLINER